MRMSLVDELNILIKSRIAENELERTLKRLNNKDASFMTLVYNKGELSKDALYSSPDAIQWRESLNKLKAFNVMVPIRKNNNYWYGFTDFGIEVMQALDLQAKAQEPNKLKQELKGN